MIKNEVFLIFMIFCSVATSLMTCVYWFTYKKNKGTDATYKLGLVVGIVNILFIVFYCLYISLEPSGWEFAQKLLLTANILAVVMIIHLVWFGLKRRAAGRLN